MTETTVLQPRAHPTPAAPPAIPPDLAHRDPAFIEATLPFTWTVLSAYFRPDIRGLDRIPATGPVLLVGNHSGGNVPPDTLLLAAAFYRHFGVERPFFQLAHHLVMAMPWLWSLPKYGTVEASWEHAEAALALGSAVLVYPGGDWETHRPSWHRNRIEFAGRDGFVRLALAADVPIVPIVSIGGQETALFLSRGERLAHALRLDRRFRLNVLPISLALPWGVDVGDMLGHIPLPAKITIQALEPIHLHERFGDRPDVAHVYEEITGLMERTLQGLADERRWPVIG